ncbi:orc1/cdc6 family replication initiation protein [Natrinema pellirubrum DSM 15624]|uniref:Orc1/cdc6 family replication initiation protein n=1 Tax=Natrinema pellirubrum (strain DSM 15624 / CIP 106293 / JCM 10476 / NCIMB 786 / 157) TaxID=797303 RepID=L9YL72_NATP1|nr:hypothetical protein [Natrinema pellirubrum]ELY73663.1 orc1/cdc6 family replication initiation protein [Natrinema pellirubrum DSM 15624]
MIRLRKFTNDELIDILLARIDAGLRPGVIGRDAVEYIADLAVGDVRKGIKLLEKATRRVDRSDRSQITLEDIDTVHDEARRDLQQDHIESLGTHKRLLFDIVADPARTA